MDFSSKTEGDSNTASVFSSQDSDVKTVRGGRVENRKTVDESLFVLKRKYWLGLGMHTFFVLVHITLIAVLYAGHLENRISVPLGRSANIASVSIVVVTQVVNQVFFFAQSSIIIKLCAQYKQTGFPSELGAHRPTTRPSSYSSQTSATDCCA